MHTTIDPITVSDCHGKPVHRDTDAGIDDHTIFNVCGLCRQKCDPVQLCPACKANKLHPNEAMHALSRYCDASICEDCGQREAFKGDFWRTLRPVSAQKPQDDGMAYDAGRDLEDSARERDMVRQENDQNDRIAEGY